MEATPETPQEETQNGESEEPNEEESQETKSEESKDEPQHIDYKKEVEVEREKQGGKSELEKALYTRKKIDERIQELGGESPKEDVDEDAIRKIVSEETESIRGTLYDEKARDIISQLTSDKDEAEAIYLKWKNGAVTSSGSLRDDLENVQLILNKKVIQKQFGEYRRTIASKETTSKGAGAGQKPTQGKMRPKLSADNEEFLAANRYQWDPLKGVFFKMKGEKRVEWTPEE